MINRKTPGPLGRYSGAPEGTVEIELSEPERQSLGQPKRLRNGQLSAFRHPQPGAWHELRRYLVHRSRRANPELETGLTAYTPGETWGLLHHPTVTRWHQQMSQLVVPSQYRAIAFVPCAKTKPWIGPAVARSQLYSAYNRLAQEFPEIFFVTVSEPLGVVPMTRWGNFPQYDNPGLFHDDSLRSGMTTEQWLASPFARKLIIPFDEAMYSRCIASLGTVIAGFMRRNRRLPMVSFVDSTSGPPTTHTAMLQHAESRSGIAIHHFAKKPVAHTSPYAYMRQILVEQRQSSVGGAVVGLSA